MGKWVKPREAAVALNIAERSVYKRAQADRIKGRTINGSLEVWLEDVDPEPDPVRELSKIAAGHMGESAASLTMMSKQLDTFQVFENTLAGEMRSSRRWGRLGWAMSFCLLAGAGGAVHLVTEKHDDELKHHRSAHETQIASFQEDNTALSVKLEITERQVGELKEDNRQLVDQLASASAVANSIIEEIKRVPASSSEELVDSITRDASISSIGLQPSHAPPGVFWSPGVEDEASHPLD